MAKCGVPLTLVQRNWIDEHRVPLALGGTNALKNRELRCIAHAKSKTFGSKATTAGSDIGNIAKVRRIRKGKMAISRRKSAPQHKYEWAKRFFRKLRSRPFPKAQRPMRSKP